MRRSEFFTQVKDSLKDHLFPSYTFPGAYQILYLDAGTNEVLCPACAYADYIASGDYRHYQRFTPFIHWEGESEFCAECNVELASEYGVPSDSEVE